MIKKLLSTVFVISIFNLLTNFNAYADVDFKPLWPLKQSVIIGGLDNHHDGTFHKSYGNGIDIYHNGYPNQDIFSVESGKVIKAYNGCYHTDSCDCNGGFGNQVIIEHNSNGKTIYSSYSHLLANSICVSTTNGNNIVKANQKIGKMGTSGRSTGEHLHLEIYQGNRLNLTPSNAIEFYLYDNLSVLKTLKFKKGLGNSPLYGEFIKEHGYISEGYYLIDEQTFHTCPTSYKNESGQWNYQTYNGVPGVCKTCKKPYKFDIEYTNISANVFFRYKGKPIQLKDKPYADARTKETAINTLQIIGKVINAYGAQWYAVNYEDANACYTYYISADNASKYYAIPPSNTNTVSAIEFSTPNAISDTSKKDTPQAEKKRP